VRTSSAASTSATAVRTTDQSPILASQRSRAIPNHLKNVFIRFLSHLSRIEGERHPPPLNLDFERYTTRHICPNPTLFWFAPTYLASEAEATSPSSTSGRLDRAGAGC